MHGKKKMTAGVTQAVAIFLLQCPSSAALAESPIKISSLASFVLPVAIEVQGRAAASTACTN
jgi:hypothetical protein